jgi:hypothetical protein
VWGTVGEDQALKGEFKVISGKMYVPLALNFSFLSLLCSVSYAFGFFFFLNLISNDLEWDGESKRIIAVGDGKEKCVSFL